MEALRGGVGDVELARLVACFRVSARGGRIEPLGSVDRGLRVEEDMLCDAVVPLVGMNETIVCGSTSSTPPLGEH